MPKPNITFEALGTHWSIEQLGEKSMDLESVLLPIVRAFESDYSRFKDDSFVSMLNRTKRLIDPPRELIDMLLFAQTMYQVGSGVFNISITPSLTGVGYGKARGEARINTTDLMGITIADGEVTLAPDVEIDFGGFGKGWLVDALADVLHSHNVHEFIINGGGDIRVSSASEVELALEHPTHEDQMIGTTRIASGGLAVSSPYKRSWKVGGVTKHHIIDPRTGESVTNDIASVYVRASTTLVADVMATILLVDPSLLDRLKKDFDLDVIVIHESQLG